jgi:hypothetical protein
LEISNDQQNRAFFLWTATFNQDRRGVLRFLAIDTSQIAQSQSQSTAEASNRPESMRLWEAEVIGRPSGFSDVRILGKGSRRITEEHHAEA